MDSSGSNRIRLASARRGEEGKRARMRETRDKLVTISFGQDTKKQPLARFPLTSSLSWLLIGQWLVTKVTVGYISDNSALVALKQVD